MQEQPMQTLTRTPTMPLTLPFSRPSASRPSIWFGMPFALSSAVLLWACYFPLNAGGLAWVALLPLLVLVRAGVSTRQALFWSWVSGMLFFLVTMQWIRVADPRMYFSWVGLSLYCSAYFPLIIWGLRRIDRTLKLPLTLTLPIVWVPLEYLRSHILGGFAWYLLAHSQHDYLAIIQVTDLAGAYAVSFMICAVNGLVFEVLCRITGFCRLVRIPVSVANSRSLAIQFLFVLPLLAGAFLYGRWRLSQDHFTEGPTVALLQSNIDQRIKIRKSQNDDEGHAAIDQMHHSLQRLINEAHAEGSNIDLMVFPETSWPHEWVEADKAVTPGEISKYWLEYRDDSRRMIANMARYSRTNVLLGLNVETMLPGNRFERFNTALLLGDDGQPVDRYDKMHCVPFGEYVPMRQTCPWMQMFAPYDHDYSLTPGEQYTRFPLHTKTGDYTFGVIICYEDSDPLLARKYSVPDGDRPAVDFLVNMSNDGWFNGTSEHEQHLAICRFRAIEARRSVVRSVNMGISAVIDGNGRVVALPGDNWDHSKKIADALVAPVPIDSRASLYARAGDWLPSGCAVVACLGLLLTFWRRK
jgi:apolipoprotein N-acyltransferase